jgi:undecaprenyl-phosphate 4-deoxy-4-formamido-L-arabinose transferase
MGARAADWVSAFRLFRTSLRDAFADCRNPAVLLDVLLSWGTTRFAAVEVDHQPRLQGRSGYTFGKLISHGLSAW